MRDFPENEKSVASKCDPHCGYLVCVVESFRGLARRGAAQLYASCLRFSGPSFVFSAAK